MDNNDQDTNEPTASSRENALSDEQLDAVFDGGQWVPLLMLMDRT